jgi:hypothetical protein
MRRLPLLAAVLASGCATRAQPYRFSSPMLGMADIPTASLHTPIPQQETKRPKPSPRRGGGWQADAQGGSIRVVSARGIEWQMPQASASAAEEVREEHYASQPAWAQLPAPHRATSTIAGAMTGAIALPHEPADLRKLVGMRDKRDPFTVLTSWTTTLGLRVEGTDGATLVAWAASVGKLEPHTATPNAGDLVVFDHVVGDSESDLVGLVLARDTRGVTEFLYVGGGVIRRGFYDATRPKIRRDVDGVVVNTFMRHGRQWPPKGTRYLSGELIAHVVHTR